MAVEMVSSSGELAAYREGAQHAQAHGAQVAARAVGVAARAVGVAARAVGVAARAVVARAEEAGEPVARPQSQVTRQNTSCQL